MFDNNEFTEEAKRKTTAITNDIGRTATKAELIEIINAIEEKTIWNILFSQNFSDFSLPKVYRKIFPLRNDVMHFHSVTYATYRKALNLFKKINEELDVQLEKGIVLENTEESVELISSQYFNTVFGGLKDSLDVIKAGFNMGTMSALREILNSIQTIKYDAEVEALTSFIKAFREQFKQNNEDKKIDEDLPLELEEGDDKK